LYLRWIRPDGRTAGTVQIGADPSLGSARMEAGPKRLPTNARGTR
jgi:hypothetical protein